MTEMLPNGFLTILQAADALLPAIYGGMPDNPLVTQLRDQGLDVGDGLARTRAMEKIWEAVDSGRLTAFAIGGRMTIRLTDTNGMPTLHSPRGRGFTGLRPSNPIYHELARYFGMQIGSATLAFEETEIHRLATRLLRARRMTQKLKGPRDRRGRPNRIRPSQVVIRDVVAKGQWDPTMSMKALTGKVNRAGRCFPLVSQDTVTRALDLLFDETKDRRFERVRRQRRGELCEHLEIKSAAGSPIGASILA
jgi:hypothetical protein